MGFTRTHAQRTYTQRNKHTHTHIHTHIHTKKQTHTHTHTHTHTTHTHTHTHTHTPMSTPVWYVLVCDFLSEVLFGGFCFKLYLKSNHIQLQCLMHLFWPQTESTVCDTEHLLLFLLIFIYFSHHRFTYLKIILWSLHQCSRSSKWKSIMKCKTKSCIFCFHWGLFLVNFLILRHCISFLKLRMIFKAQSSTEVNREEKKKKKKV